MWPEGFDKQTLVAVAKAQPSYNVRQDIIGGDLSLAPRVLRSTKYPAWSRKKAMSSPLTPVRSGSPEPAVKVVVSFCLK
jgi:hypothetical protein